MGHSQVEKIDSHERIVEIAARRLRELGVDGIGVADLMREAGLTHGGFYKHFATREELVAEGIERALHDGSKGAFDAEQAARIAGPALLFALIEWYLGTAHRDDLATSCAVTSLARDVARSGDRVRTAYTDTAKAYIELFVRLMPGAAAGKVKREKAIVAWAMLVGAVSMARATNDDELSREMLRTCARRLESFLGATNP